MKTLKFRVWDHCFKKWAKKLLVDEDGVLYCPTLGGSIAEVDLHNYYNQRFEISYSTGHFDDNNFEVFEGDILSTTNDYYPIYLVQYGYDRYKNQEIEIMGFVIPYSNYKII